MPKQTEKKRTSKPSPETTKKDAEKEARPERAGADRSLVWVCNGLMILGVALLVVAFALWSLQASSAMRTWTRVVAGLAFACFIAAIVVGWHDVRRWARIRATQEGLVSLAYILAVWALIVVGIYMGVRHAARADLTKERVYSLSPKTLSVIKGLSQPVEIYTCVRKSSQNSALDQKVDDLTRLYKGAGSKVKVEQLNPDRHLAKMRDLGINNQTDVVFVRAKPKNSEDKPKSQTISSFDINEQKVTSAILNVTTDERKKIYLVQGHGEYMLEDQGRPEYALTKLKKLLEEDNYEVASLNLTGEGKIPADARVLVIPGATMPIPEKDLDVVSAWLDNGGRVLILATSRVAEKDAPDYAKILETWKIGIRTDLVCDAGSPIGIPQLVIIDPGSFPNHAINKGNQRSAMYFGPNACSLRVETSGPTQPGQPPPPGAPSELVKTSDLAFGKSDLTGSFRVGPSDTPGPLVLAACAERTLPGGDAGAEASSSGDDKDAKTPDKKAKIVVLGDADLCIDGDVVIGGSVLARTPDRQYVRNCIHWLAEADDLIGIAPKEDKGEPLSLSKQAAAWNRFFCFLIPLVPLAAGLGVWFTRRS